MVGGGKKMDAHSPGYGLSCYKGRAEFHLVFAEGGVAVQLPGVPSREGGKGMRRLVNGERRMA